MDEHTPGPWMIDPGWTLFTHELWGRVQYPTISHAKVGNVAYVVPKVDGRRDATGEANARLIAAAPDLLEACKALVAKKFGPPDVLKMAESTITKAAGRT